MQTQIAVSSESLQKEQVEDLWERAFPGRGEAVMDILGPCHESSVMIGSPIPGSAVFDEDIMDIARDVYHWLVEKNGLFVRTVEKRYLSGFRTTRVKAFQWLDEILKKRYPLREQIPSACLWAMAAGNASGFEHLGDVLPLKFRIRLWESYMSVLKMGLAYATSDTFSDEKGYFKRLIRVWHNGCPPVGYGVTNRGVGAVVFIAENRPFP